MRHTRGLVVSLLLIASSVYAQERGAREPLNRKKLAVGDRLTRLKKRVDRLDVFRADVPAIAETLRGLQREVTALRRMIQDKKSIIRGYKALRAQVEALGERIDGLDLRLSMVTLRAASSGSSCEDAICLRALGGKIALRVRGLLQSEYEGIIPSSRRDLAGSSLGQPASSFLIARGRLFLKGHLIDPRLGVQIGLEAGTRTERFLYEATATFRWHRMLRVAAGLQRVPFGRQFASDLSSMRFRDRSPVSRAFYPGRDIGLLISGHLLDSIHFGRLSYQVGVFNGAGLRGGEFQDDNTDFLYAARVTYAPLGPLGKKESDDHFWTRPRMAIGASFFYNLVKTDLAARLGATDPSQQERLRDQDGDGEVDNVGIVGLNAELAIRWRGLSWQSELFYRHEDPGAVADSRRYWGTYTQVGVAHASGFEVTARYAFWELSRYGADGTVVSPARIHEAAMAVGIWLFERRLRLLTTYAHRWLRGLETRAAGALRDAKLREHRVYVQTQIAF